MSRDRRLLGSAVLLVSLTLGLVGLSPASAPARAAANGQITGTVTGPGGAPVPGASVSAYPTDCDNGCSSYGSSMAADGSYVVADLPPGSYLLLFQAGFGYLAEYYDNALEPEGATEVMVTAGSTVTGINAQLEHGGHLSGTVTGRGGRPLKGITVTVYAKQGRQWRYAGETSTARNGSYQAGGDGLLSGVYRLRFTDNSEPGYLTQYYRGASTLARATDVVLGENQTVTGLDARLAWPRTLRMVKAPKVIGKPKAGATLRLRPGTWRPGKVRVEVMGWYADNLYQYLGSHTKKITLTGRTLAQARGKFLKVRFKVSAPGYATVDRTLTVPGGPVR